ncbi:hypothetical protein U1Q18_032562 [Sarracenia purpurea var. burkii]
MTVICYNLLLGFQVIGAVLNSIGIGSQAATNVIGGVQPTMQFNTPVQMSLGHETERARDSTGAQSQAGTQVEPGQALPKWLQIPWFLAADASVALAELAAQLDDGKGLAQTVADVKDANKTGAFHFAAREGKTEVCKFLVEDLKLNVDTKDKDGMICTLYGTSTVEITNTENGILGAKSTGRCFNPGSITNNNKHENKDHNIDKEQVISADSSPLNLEKANKNEALDIEEGQIITEDANQNLVVENFGSEDCAETSGEKKKSLHDEDDAARGDTVGDVCENPRILEMMAKMEKRRERFKEPMTLKRVTEEVAESPWGQVTMKQGNQGAVSLARAIPSSTGFGH